MDMKIQSFFKLLKNKIEKYDNCISNPFASPQPITLIWVENETNNSNYNYKPFDEHKK